MFCDKPEWMEHQRRRWMRPDAHRWIRPDAHRWLRPDYKRFLQPGAEPWLLLALLEGKANFNPSQPRVPAGSPEGGQWTDDSGGAGEETAEDFENIEDTPTEFSAANRARGHHYLPRSIYKDMQLSPETRKVFDDATTGPIGLRARSEDGLLKGHFWDGPKGAHGLYNDAAGELMNSFMQSNGISPEDMTPQQARVLIDKIKESQNPRIRDYLNSIRLLQYLRRLRIGGRGSE